MSSAQNEPRSKQNGACEEADRWGTAKMTEREGMNEQ